MGKKGFLYTAGATAMSLALLANPFDVSAAEQEPDGLALEIAEITDVEELIERAIVGIDEFKEATGLDFNISAELIPETGNDSDYTLEVYQTSQYLGKLENEEGELTDVYALQGIMVYDEPITVDDQQSNGGCTIKTTMYIQRDSEYIQFKLLRSEANLSGTLQPSSLQMDNYIGAGPAAGGFHHATKTVSLPSNGIHTLYPTYNGYVSEAFSYFAAVDTLSFGSGGTLSTYTYFDCTNPYY